MDFENRLPALIRPEVGTPAPPQLLTEPRPIGSGRSPILIETSPQSQTSHFDWLAVLFDTCFTVFVA